VIGVCPILRRHALVAACVAAFLASPAAGEDGGTLDLEALVAEATSRHPAVRSVRESASAAREVPSRVASLPDPMVGVQAQNIRIDAPALDTSPMSAIQLGLTQNVPFPGKLGRRGAVAEARADVAERHVEATQTSVALSVRKTYWQLHFAERGLAITTQSERVMDGLANAVTARVAVGKAPQQDAVQAMVAQSGARARVQEYRELVRSLQRALNAAVGRPPADGLAPTAASQQAAAAGRGELVEQALAASPTLLVARARVSAAERAVAEAEYDRWPDLQLGAGYRIRAVVPGDPSAGADMFGATLGVTLPVFMGSKQNARVREARFELAAAREAVESIALDVTAALERALDAVERLDEELALYRKELLPEAQRALDASVSDYQVGGVGFVSVLQNWQTLLTVQLAWERLLSDRSQRLAEVRALTSKEVSP